MFCYLQPEWFADEPASVLVVDFDAGGGFRRDVVKFEIDAGCGEIHIGGDGAGSGEGIRSHRAGGERPAGSDAGQLFIDRNLAAQSI